MRIQGKFYTFLIILSFLLCGTFAYAAAANNCVTCHTNESLMKSLHKPPPLPAGEGEG